MKCTVRCVAAILLLVLIRHSAFATDPTTQRSPTPPEILAVRGAAMVPELRIMRHKLLVSAIAPDRRDHAVHVIDETITRQLKLIGEAVKTPSASEELVRQAAANASQVETLPNSNWQSEKRAVGALAGEKFRTLLTPAQLKAWELELTGAKRAKS